MMTRHSLMPKPYGQSIVSNPALSLEAPMSVLGQFSLGHGWLGVVRGRTMTY